LPRVLGLCWETLTVTLASKEVERAELHKTIWRIANDLRGSVDGWDCKSYVLGCSSTGVSARTWRPI